MLRIFALLSVVTLSACSSLLKPLDTTPVTQQQTPKHEIRLISDNAVLTDIANQSLLNTGAVILGKEQSDAQFSLILSAQQRTAESAVPKLIGRLGEIDVKPELKISYQLINKSGEMLIKDTVITKGSLQKVLFPSSSNASRYLNESLVQKALAQILPEVIAELNRTPVAKDVLSREGIGQVTIAASPEQGFAVNNSFLNPGTGSRLRLTRFESYPFPKAYLILEDGELPEAGDTLEFIE